MSSKNRNRRKIKSKQKKMVNQVRPLKNTMEANFTAKIEDTILSPKKNTTLFKILSSGYSIVIFISVILGLSGYFTFKSEVYKLLSSEQELFEEEHFQKGIIIPDYKESPFLNIHFGTVICSYDNNNIADEVEYIPGLITCEGSQEVPFDLRIMFRKGRLLISATFKDLIREEIVGKMRNNKWDLFKSNMLNYYSGDDFLEVMDKQGHVVFQLGFIPPNNVQIKGYSVLDNNITVISNSMACYDRNDPRILKLIKEILPIHLK